MVEIAFMIEKDNNSDFYNKYFASKNEKQKFHDYAREFFNKHNLLQSSKYYQRERLGLELTKEQKEQFSTQLKKYADENGLYCFKKNSPMQKEWEKDVVNNVDMEIFHSIDFWYWAYIRHGRYSLWDNNGNIYGYLCDSSKTEIKLSDCMTPIKLSEYYSIIESIENKE